MLRGGKKSPIVSRIRSKTIDFRRSIDRNVEKRGGKKNIRALVFHEFEISKDGNIFPLQFSPTRLSLVAVEARVTTRENFRKEGEYP